MCKKFRSEWVELVCSSDESELKGSGNKKAHQVMWFRLFMKHLKRIYNAILTETNRYFYWRVWLRLRLKATVVILSIDILSIGPRQKAEDPHRMFTFRRSMLRPPLHTLREKISYERQTFMPRFASLENIWYLLRFAYECCARSGML